jgi:hypothetical protein
MTSPAAGLLDALRQLDALLQSAVGIAAEVNGPEATTDTYLSDSRTRPWCLMR